MSEDNKNGLEDLLNESTKETSQQKSQQQQQPVRKGNEVFAGDGIQKVTREQYVQKEFGFEIPLDAVPLPSKGRIYPENHPLHNAESVEYRAMTAAEEDILMSEALIKKGTVISELIRSCLTNKNIDVKSLLSGDQQAIMMAIRISGYGRMYEPEFECPACKVPNKMGIDLAEFTIRNLELDPVEPGQNLFSFELPMTKKTVHFKFLTVAEEEKAVADAEWKKKKGMLKNNLITSQLMNSIVAVDGEQSKGWITRFVENMPARDSMELRRHILRNQPSVETKVDFQCQSCDHFKSVDMPMTLEFFWPGSSDA